MLDSILSGTVLPFEIILINDGSDDGSLDTAYSYADKHSFIRVLSQAHAGVSAARNLGLQNASGYWISFLDADDYIEPDMYERMLEAITASAEGNDNEDCLTDGCLCGYFTHKDGLVTPYSPPHSTTLTSEEILKHIFTDDSVRGFLFTRLFKAEMLRGLTFDADIRICEDLLFQTRLFSLRNLRFACLPVPLYHYIQNQSSVTASLKYFEGNTFIYKPAFNRISDHVHENYVLDNYNSILEYSMYMLLEHYVSVKDRETLAQIRLLQKEMRMTKTPFTQKSQRRIAYELAPIILGKLH